jgi:hypothetical protein
MPTQIKSATADYSLCSIRIIEARYGMDPANLVALYDFADGAEGVAYTGTGGAITDRSGNGNHAAILAGSTIFKTARGVATAQQKAAFTGAITGNSLAVTTSASGALGIGDTIFDAGVPVCTILSGAGPYTVTATPDLASRPLTAMLANRGFYAKAPFLLGTGSFVLVLQDLLPPVSTKQTMYLGASANCALNGVNNTTEKLGSENIGTRGMLRFYRTSSTLTRISEQSIKTDSATAWSAAPNVRNIDSAAPNGRWACAAGSIDATTGTVIMRFAGQTVTFTDITAMTTWLGVADSHWCFGMAAYGNAFADAGALGNMAMAAFYSDARSAAGLDALISQAKIKLSVLPGFAGVTIA